MPVPLDDVDHPVEIPLGGAPSPPMLRLDRTNRHGLVAGATGTGKTVTLQVMAEGFSARGVPVFIADIKGDLAGLARAGERDPKLEARAKAIQLARYDLKGCPVTFWDVFGEQGHPIRTTVSEMGPVMISRLLELADAQEGALNIAFKVADDEGLLLLDLKDLRAMLSHIGERAAELTLKYGNVNPGSIGAIQRRLLVLEQQGAENFFGEPALDITDFLRRDAQGQGVVNVLAADRLMEHPRLYATFLLWILSELFEELPEVGDVDKPRLVFFFDEAHLLFKDAPAALLDKVAQLVRLVRSKGVGVFFVTQNPLDVPDEVLGQLGNRAQHALRAFTPRDQKAVKAAAQTFRADPDFDVTTAITQLGVGEALVSVLDAKGTPGVVQRTLIRPPASRMGPIAPAERAHILEQSPLMGRYDVSVDRESAYEQLVKRAAAPAGQGTNSAGGPIPKSSKGGADTGSGAPRRGSPRTLASTLGREIGRQASRELVRGIMGLLRR